MNKLSIYDIQYWASVNGGPYEPLNFPAPKAHIVIKRTRKRQIEKAKLMAMTPYQRKIYKGSKVLTHIFAAIGRSTKMSSDNKASKVLNRKRWK